jgi:hypothetical protein
MTPVLSAFDGGFGMRLSWDIFCSVIDTFGDSDVTWRLARQLVAGHDQPVSLWGMIWCAAGACTPRQTTEGRRLSGF